MTTLYDLEQAIAERCSTLLSQLIHGTPKVHVRDRGAQTMSIAAEEFDEAKK